MIHNVKAVNNPPNEVIEYIDIRLKADPTSIAGISPDVTEKNKVQFFNILISHICKQVLTLTSQYCPKMYLSDKCVLCWCSEKKET